MNGSRRFVVECQNNLMIAMIVPMSLRRGKEIGSMKTEKKTGERHSESIFLSYLSVAFCFGCSEIIFFSVEE